MLSATAEQRLHEVTIETDKRSAATVVAVSGGYPGEYEKGKVILGLEGTVLDNTIIFQSGTVADNEDILTDGGRVLAITSFADTITEAVEQSVYMLEQLHFEGIYYRNDIGFEFKQPENEGE